MNNNFDIEQFLNLSNSEYHFFSYADLHIDKISQVIGRVSDTIEYYPSKVLGYYMIFSESSDKTHSVASLHRKTNYMDDTIRGISIKLSEEELIKLMNYVDPDYILCKITVYLSRVYEPESIQCYTFVKKFIGNPKKILPSIEYLQSINTMLCDRQKLKPGSVVEPIYFYYVKTKRKNIPNSKLLTFGTPQFFGVYDHAKYPNIIQQ